MFCPECKTEYREGFYACADCVVPLVRELPPEPEKIQENIELEEILSTFNLTDIVLIKSFLDKEGIEHYVSDERTNRLYPTAVPVRLFVKKEDALGVRELLKDFKLFYRPF